MKQLLDTLQTTKSINVGEIHVLRNGETASMILGSCISVIFHSENKNVSLVCHAQLPEQTNKTLDCRVQCTNPCDVSVDSGNKHKFVTCSLICMFGILKYNNINKNELTTHLYGGASLLSNDVIKSIKPIGIQNIEKAKQILEKENIIINKSDFGGNKGRKILFDSKTGEVILSINNPLAI